MTQYFARVVSGVVVEIITLPDDVAVADAFHDDIVSALVAATAEITVGQTYSSGAFGPVPEPPAPTQAQLQAAAAAKAHKRTAKAGAKKARPTKRRGA